MYTEMCSLDMSCVRLVERAAPPESFITSGKGVGVCARAC